MSSTMSTFRIPNHTWSPSTSPTRPIRMSTTPKICANRLSTMSGEPPVCVAYVSRRKVYVLGHLVDAPLPTLIHRSAWNRNSANFAFWAFSEVRPQESRLLSGGRHRRGVAQQQLLLRGHDHRRVHTLHPP